MVIESNISSDAVYSAVRPLALLPMKGCEKIGTAVNDYLLEWSSQPKNSQLLSFPGYNKSSFLIKADCPRFGTGESKGIIQESVRGYDLYIICDVTNYHVTYSMYNKESAMSPDDHFADLKRLIGAAGCKPHRIHVIMPFLYEGRQHRRTARESLDCAVALQELYHLGVDSIITFDAHDPRVQNAVPTNNFDSVQSAYQILKSILRFAPDMVIDKDHTMVISPDEGAAARNIYYASMMGLDMGLFYKRRDYSKVVGGRNPIVAHEYLGDNVEGKDVIIADDILATGESLLDIAKELKRRKARRVFLATTFALFTCGTDVYEQAYNDGLFDQLFATNLTHLDHNLKSAPWFTEVNMSKYIALLIATINHDNSLSDLLNPNDRMQDLLSKHRAGLQL